MNLQELIKKYDVPVPRYTSYPTVPFWDTDTFTTEGWWNAVSRCFSETNSTLGISLYIHLPFCESLCTYCACNTRITRNHKVEELYVEALLKEWQLYRNRFDKAPAIREIHLGGGTPTFFSPSNLQRLLGGILEGAMVRSDRSFSFEGHPNNTTDEHLGALAGLGFDRVSFGVQDLDEKVQIAINRIQPFENVESVVAQSRQHGFRSVSFDLVYGLPYQTVEGVRKTVEKLISLLPERIAFYSYAHVPWMRPGQRGYEDADLPGDVAKRALYEAGRELFLNAGYTDIGMDHFALQTDSLAVAKRDGSLHRNFMGYTTNPTELLIGLGASSISDAKYAYAQNLKKVEDYEQAVFDGSGATFKGHIQTSDDIRIRRCILDIACRGEVEIRKVEAIADDAQWKRLRTMVAENIISTTDDHIRVTEPGRTFIRNICSVFDKRLAAFENSAKPVFSKAI